jgi:hypothetical protein
LDAAWLRAERDQISPLVFASEYECTFTDSELSVFPSELVYAALSTEVKPLLPVSTTLHIGVMLESGR